MEKTVINLKCPPSRTCVLCEKPIEQIGGKRIIAQKARGIALSSQYQGGGNKDFPYQSFKLYAYRDVYLTVWGEKGLWTTSVIERAKSEYLSGHRPWFCQICGKRACSECGAPINLPVGSDIIHGNGDSTHVAILPVDAGCVNPQCPKYRKFGDSN
jgi:hypothetical protein